MVNSFRFILFFKREKFGTQCHLLITARPAKQALHSVFRLALRLLPQSAKPPAPREKLRERYKHFPLTILTYPPILGQPLGLFEVLCGHKELPQLKCVSLLVCQCVSVLVCQSVSLLYCQRFMLTNKLTNTIKPTHQPTNPLTHQPTNLPTYLRPQCEAERKAGQFIREPPLDAPDSRATFRCLFPLLRSLLALLI